MTAHRTNRRTFLKQTSAGAMVAAGACGTALASDEVARSYPTPTADSCIFIWLGGGASHIDTFDPKRRGDPQAKKPGSDYASIDSAIDGVQVCEHLQRTARLLDRCVLMRTIHHDVINEHAAAVNRVHTGRPTTGTTIYPSIGSVVAHELGARGDGVPPYVVMGYPSASRGPGFLGAQHSYVYLTDTEAGPAGLQRAPGITRTRQQRRERLLGGLRDRYREKHAGEAKIDDYVSTSIAGLNLAGPKFMNVFDLNSEKAQIRSAYGSEFGQRCLLARRLVQSGVRFVEVSFNLNFINGTGWDTHREGQRNQYLLIQQLDQALAALIEDLQRLQRLDRTLIAIGTEFGRPPEFDSGGGRGHQSTAFSCVLAGGGLQTGQAIGVTDELAQKIVERPVSVPDFHASIYVAMGVDPAKELYDGDRPVPITDRGNYVQELFG